MDQLKEVWQNIHFFFDKIEIEKSLKRREKIHKGFTLNYAYHFVT